MSKDNIDSRSFKEKILNELLHGISHEFTSAEKKIQERIEIYRNKNSKEEKIDTTDWKPFAIGELFSTPPIEKPAKRAYAKYSEGTIPFVASGNYNNGVQGYVKAQENEKLDFGNCITVSAVDGSTFYQNADFLGRGGGGSSINIIRHDRLNEATGLFLATIIGKICSKYKFADMCSKAALKEEIIYLPAINGKPDWGYIEKYIKNMSYADMICK